MPFKLDLPEDVAVEGYRCVRVYVPDSDDYEQALHSLLTYPGNWFGWERDDAKRGKDAAQLWRNAYQLTTSDFIEGKSCDDCDCPECPEVPCPYGRGGYSELDESEDEMPGVTWLEIEDGILYMYFGPCCKVAVGGSFETVLDPPPDPPVVDPGDPQTWACNKAAGMALRFWAAAASGITEMGAVDAAHRAQKLIETLPQFNISHERAKMAALAYTADTVENQAMLADPDTEPYIRCKWAAVLEETDGITEAEFSVMQSVLSSQFTTVQASLLVNLMLAMTRTPFNWWAKAYAEVVADCECPETPAPTPPVTFTGEHTFNNDPGVFLIDHGAQQNGKRFYVFWDAANGINRDVEDHRMELQGSQAQDVITFRLTPDDAYIECPGDDYLNDAAPLLDPQLWVKTWAHGWDGQMPTYEYTYGAGWVETKITLAVDNTNGMPYVELNPRWVNANGTGYGWSPGKTYQYNLDIVEVNGVSYR